MEEGPLYLPGQPTAESGEGLKRKGEGGGSSPFLLLLPNFEKVGAIGKGDGEGRKRKKKRKRESPTLWRAFSLFAHPRAAEGGNRDRLSQTRGRVRWDNQFFKSRVRTPTTAPEKKKNSDSFGRLHRGTMGKRMN